MGTILTPESVVYAILAFAQIITLPIDFMQERFVFFGKFILLFSAVLFYVFRQFYFVFFGTFILCFSDKLLYTRSRFQEFNFFDFLKATSDLNFYLLPFQTDVQKQWYVVLAHKRLCFLQNAPNSAPFYKFFNLVKYDCQKL